MVTQSPELIMVILGAVSLLILAWIIIIHLRVNRLRKAIENLKKVAEE